MWTVTTGFVIINSSEQKAWQSVCFLFYRLEVWKQETGGFWGRNMCFQLEKLGGIEGLFLFFTFSFFLLVFDIQWREEQVILIL